MPRRTLLITTLALTALASLLWACTDDEKEADLMTPTTDAGHTNRLIHATSPYLQQHAHNPVDWHEWNEEALAQARKLNKPIFLSIGYAACHWCHVMAHESFENEATAAVMNEHFINIKVDREERPDLDQIYMQATMILNQGQGGWPMSVWLTPDLKPFFAGTYFPPEARWGRPGFREICARIAELWETRREDIQKDADHLTAAVERSLGTTGDGDGQLNLDIVDQAISTLAQAFDAQRGGMSGGSTNKFPPSMTLDLFLRAIHRDAFTQPTRKNLRALVETTLDRMARGGIYDQLGGGIHRYSTDVEWLVPHFEKMLYDQALVSRVYIDAYQLLDKPLYADVARDIFDYVLTDLQSNEGGFYSTRDADSEGEEGKYYVWTRAEIVSVLGESDAGLFCTYYNVSESGNWQDPHAPGVAKNILHISRNLDDIAGEFGLTPAAAAAQLEAARRKLLAQRSQRVAPGLDDKVLAEWNGMMIASLAHGGAVLGEQKYVAAAAKAADFILTHQLQGDRLCRAYRAGKRLETAFLTDYACMIDGLLNLYEATFERRWLDAARTLNDTVIAHFHDESRGGFFFTADDHERLLTRSKDIRDAATPSGNSVQLMNLLRLGVMFGDEGTRATAQQTMRTFAGQIARMPAASERFLAAVEFAHLGPVELAVVGNPDAPGTQDLLRTVSAAYLPNRVLMLADPTAASQSITSPLLANRTQVDEHPTVYVCRNYTCQQPTSSAAELRAQLSR